MKRLDRTTHNLMIRLALPLVFGALLVAPLLDNRAQAKDDVVQQWMQTKRVTMAINQKWPTGQVFADQVNITNIASDIRFDPRNLDDSIVIFGASFLPVKLPGNRAVDEDAQRAASMLFQSDKIRQTGDTTFDVTGYVKMNERTQPVLFPMTVAYGGAQQGQPTLVFSGQMNAPIGQLAPELGLPKYLPITFAFETTAAP